MGQALYRKHRPKGLAEIVGQEHVTRALTRALEQNKINHAYLFTGPRGVGKTTIARILAHEVNGLPYTDESVHLDIIEIDAASNRRIDEIRDLRDKVHIAPTSAKYKVYIVDEVHMLTREAFNALLKTLEEPPAHVIFILATTEMHKLPETIVSRTQHYAFKLYEKETVVDHLKTIAKQEKLKVDDDALDLIAQHGGGSFRDSISLLDQVRNYADIVTRADVETMLGIAPEQLVTSAAVLRILQDLRSQGVAPAMMAKQLAGWVRIELIQNSLPLSNDIALELLERLVEVSASSDPFTALELALLGAVFVQKQPQPAVVPATLTDSAPLPAKQAIREVVTKAEAPKNKNTQPAVEPVSVVATEIVPAQVTTPGISDNTWPEVLTQIKKTYNTMYGVLRMAEPVFDGNILTLTFEFSFHQKRANDPKNKKIIMDAIKKISGKKVELVCVVGNVSGNPKAGTPEPVKAAADASLGAISNIFGGGELLES
jgi:DNA polymerase-3 subunit gamma/tau